MQQSTAERTPAAVVGLAGTVAGLLGHHSPELILWIFALMGFDLASGLLRALIRDDEDVDGRIFAIGVLKKLLMIFLLAPAAAVDRALHLSEMIADSAGPTAFAVMIGLMMYEAASITKNVKAAVGSTLITIHLLRAIDAVRFGGKTPNDRHYDPPGKDEP